MKHTQGPWTTSSVDKRIILSCGTGAAKVAIALDEFDDNPGGPKAFCESYANALLIAAAPELLDALNRITEKTERANAIQHSGGKIHAEDWGELYQLANEARAAIAKATGTK